MSGLGSLLAWTSANASVSVSEIVLVIMTVASTMNFMISKLIFPNLWTYTYVVQDMN